MNLIRTHKDLDVFQLAFNVAMKIFEISKSFPKGEVRDQLLQIFLRHFGKEDMRKLLFLNFPMQKVRLPKPKFGLLLLINAII